MNITKRAAFTIAVLLTAVFSCEQKQSVTNTSTPKGHELLDPTDCQNGRWLGL